jgi:hypothetical protein
LKTSSLNQKVFNFIKKLTRYAICETSFVPHNRNEWQTSKDRLQIVYESFWFRTGLRNLYFVAYSLWKILASAFGGFGNSVLHTDFFKENFL